MAEIVSIKPKKGKRELIKAFSLDVDISMLVTPFEEYYEPRVREAVKRLKGVYVERLARRFRRGILTNQEIESGMKVNPDDFRQCYNSLHNVEERIGCTIVYPDTLPFLKKASLYGYKLFAITAAPSNITYKILERFGILEHLLFVMYAGYDGVPPKDNPKAFSYAIRKLWGAGVTDINPINCVHVGDTPNDKLMAESGGARFVLIEREGEDHEVCDWAYAHRKPIKTLEEIWELDVMKDGVFTL